MKNLIITILLCGIWLNLPAQGLGMTQNEIQLVRKNEKCIEGTLTSGFKYAQYDCTKDEFCITTTYVYENDIVILVMDVYDEIILENTLLFLNKNFERIKEYTWVDEKEGNIISMTIDLKYNHFIIAYTWLYDK